MYPTSPSPEAELTLHTHATDPWTKVQEVVYLARRLERQSPSAAAHA